MSRTEIKQQIKQLKNEMDSVNKATDVRLLKLTVLFLALVLIAAVVYGKIQIQIPL